MKNKILLFTLVAFIGFATIIKAQNVPFYVPTDGLVGWWPFNGNANDESGNENNGIVNGAMLTTDRYGITNQAYYFNGANNYISMNSLLNIPMGNSARTISVWMNPAIIAGEWTLTAVAYGSPSRSKAYMIGLSPNNICVQGWETGVGTQLNYSTNQWINAICTYDGINVNFYINGNIIGGDTISILNTTGTEFNFGNRVSLGHGWFDGKLDDIGIWNRVLTQQEITNLYLCPPHYNFEGGNPADPVWTIYLDGATLDSLDLQPMDEIAIFDSTTMVGAYRLTEVLTPGNVTNNYITAFKTLTNGPGYTPGHNFSFKYWDASTLTEIDYYNISLLNPWGDAWTENVFPENDGEYSVANFHFISDVTKEFNLHTGYQFISSYATPPNPDMSVALAELMNDNLSFVRSSGGNMFRKLGTNWVNNIGNWVITEGYLVKMNAPDGFSITGRPVIPLTPINLSTGYQFISYLHDYSMNAATAFAGIMNNNLSFIRNSGGDMLRKLGSNWVNNIGNVVPGEGYLVKMNAPDTLVYPSGVKSILTKKTITNSHFMFEGGNAADPVYTIYISDATINGYSLQSGDEIGVFDGQTLVGSLTLTQIPTPENQTENAIPVFATLNSGEGFIVNHPVTFKLWSASQGMEYDGIIATMKNPYGDAYTGKIYPNKDGVYSIASLKAMITGINKPDFTKITIYPNPNKGIFTLQINNKNTQEYTVSVSNGLGIVVFQKDHLLIDNGSNTFTLNLSNLVNGIYTLSVRCNENSFNQRLIIQK